ncbi:hypothetical protein Tco_0817703, partial [Tanacetum coccineum]
MRACSPRVFKRAQQSFDAALRSTLKHIITASGPGLQSTSFHTTLLRHTDIVTNGPTFGIDLSAFNAKMEIDLLINSSVPIFLVPKLCSACSKVFTWNIYGDHHVSCVGIVGIKHRHNLVRDTFVKICFRSGISAGKEVDIRLGGRKDKPLRLADMFLYSWDRGLNICADLTGSSPLMQIMMLEFVSGRAVIMEHSVNVLSMRQSAQTLDTVFFTSYLVTPPKCRSEK